MREVCRGLNFRRIILVSILLGASFGSINTVGAWDDGPPISLPPGFVCPGAAGSECSSNGCRKSSNYPDSYWVCNYSGSGCPPLEACQDR
jgi:hypothetical protein